MQDSITQMKQPKSGPIKRKFSRISTNALAFAELVYQLQNGEYGVRELAELCGISEDSVRLWLSYLRRPGKKLVYICERRKTSSTGARMLIYTWGPDKDDVPVIRLTRKQYLENWKRNRQLRILNGTANTHHG